MAVDASVKIQTTGILMCSDVSFYVFNGNEAMDSILSALIESPIQQNEAVVLLRCGRSCCSCCYPTSHNHISAPQQPLPVDKWVLAGRRKYFAHKHVTCGSFLTCCRLQSAEEGNAHQGNIVDLSGKSWSWHGLFTASCFICPASICSFLGRELIGTSLLLHTTFYSSAACSSFTSC